MRWAQPPASRPGYPSNSDTAPVPAFEAAGHRFASCRARHGLGAVHTTKTLRRTGGGSVGGSSPPIASTRTRNASPRGRFLSHAISIGTPVWKTKSGWQVPARDLPCRGRPWPAAGPAVSNGASGFMWNSAGRRRPEHRPAWTRLHHSTRLTDAAAERWMATVLRPGSRGWCRARNQFFGQN